MNKSNFYCLVLFALIPSMYFAQCPNISLDKITYSIAINNFADFLNNKTINGVTYVNVDASAPCTWDLYATTIAFNSNPYTASATQDAFNLTNINIRVQNICETAEQDYGGGTPPCTADPTRICYSVWNNPLAVATNNYIVGTDNVLLPGSDGILPKSQAPCLATNINDNGTASTSPTTHRFRIDVQLDFSAFPGTVITPGFYEVDLDFVAIDDATGIEMDRESFTLEIEIEPILQLNMKTLSQLDFNFTDTKQYNAGIIKYGATKLNVSSNMNWDLIAVGTSSRNEAGAPYWDDTPYSAGGSSDIPINALELHQTPANPFGGDDYSAAFITPPTPLPLPNGANNIEVGTGVSLLVPEPLSLSLGEKTIAGDWDGALGGGNFMTPGSYLISGGGWNVADFKYVIDYRLTPRLPATFGNGTPAMVNYASAGFYTMQVRYLLTEDQ